MKREPIVTFWQGESGRWYWHLKAANGKIVSEGGEGYSTKSNARRAWKRQLQLAYQVQLCAYVEKHIFNHPGRLANPKAKKAKL